MGTGRTVGSIGLGLGITLYVTNELTLLGLDSTWLDSLLPGFPITLRNLILLGIPVAVGLAVGL